MTLPENEPDPRPDDKNDQARDSQLDSNQKIKKLISANQDESQPGWRPPAQNNNPNASGGWYGEGEPPFNDHAANDKQSTFNLSSLFSNNPTQVILPVSRDNETTIPPQETKPAGIPITRPPERDVNATRVLPVTPATSFKSTDRQDQPFQQPTQRSKPASTQKIRNTQSVGNTNKPAENDRPSSLKTGLGCFLQGFIFCLFSFAIILVVLASITVYQYFSLINNSSFPDVKNLKQHASTFETTKIYDRNGNMLYELLDPNAGRRTYIPLNKISPYLIAATIATEDKEYYNHPGFDPLAITRALWQNYTTGEVVSGASTITQQLARSFLLSSTERNEKTVQRKAKEIVLASEMTRMYSKEEILELYLNENNYGNLSYGIEAAAETYFNTTADKLTLGQAAFLAGLPQAPSVYDINTNRDATLNRQKQVLVLMYQTSQEKSCIYVSTNVEKVCITPEIVIQGAKEIENYQFSLPQNNMSHPHWVNYIRSVLEQQFGTQTIYMSGFSVVTTLDATLQQKAEEVVKNQVQKLADLNVKGGALVAINPATGEILAMVGSPDFNNQDAAGQINMAITPRQPGSSIKPLTYVAAFEKGWTPSTLIWDIPSEFPPSGNPSDPNPPYKPVNYDGRFHGPVLVRDALANSYNIPAVKTLRFVGIYDDPATKEADGFINFASRLGITTLDRKDYGLSLTLGGGDVPLLELTSAYGVFANAGKRVPPISILKIVNFKGETVYENPQAQPQQVVRPEHAYLMSSILSDNHARTPMFGSNSVLHQAFNVAVKTGTTNDFRDNWTIGYTPDLVVGVWVGNPDYTPMRNTTGLTGAAPIWSEFMQFAIQKLTGGNPAPFVRPPGISEKIICGLSGTEPSDGCPTQKSEIFASDQLPLSKGNDFWQKTNIDTWTGNRASPTCSDYMEEKSVLNITDTDARKWIQNTNEGKVWAANIGFKENITFMPEKECSNSDPRPNIYFEALNEGQTITNSPLDIYAIIDATANFKDFNLEYGKGDKPTEWTSLLSGVTTKYQNPDRIYTWNVDKIEPGLYTLRIYLHSTDDGRFAEKDIHLNIAVPTLTVIASPTFTSTPIFTPTPTVASTLTFTPTTTATFPVAASLTPTIIATTPVPTVLPLPTLTPTSH